MKDVTAFIKNRKKTDKESAGRSGEDAKALLKIMRETVVREDDARRVAVPKRARYP